MAKLFKIYINDNALLISNELPKNMEHFRKLGNDNFDFRAFYKNMTKVSGQQFIIVSEDPASLFKVVKKSCSLIKAAGGLVESNKGKHLFIYRNKKWDLPKGKVEKGEKMKEAAVREVEEECGVKVSRSHEKICKTYHVYTLGSKVILKKTNWYRMEIKGEPKLIPQKEEGITKAVWLHKTDLKPVLKNTYPSILQVLEAAGML